MMQEFLYEGVRQDGRKVKGKREAKSRAELLRELKEEGIVPVSVSPVKGKLSLFELRLGRGVSYEDLAFVFIQLSTMLRAGIPLPTAVGLLSSQVENPLISRALEEIKTKLEKGKSVASAFAESDVFPEFVPHTLASAETAENLEEVLESVGHYLETLADMKSKLMNALMYPAFVITLSFLAVMVSVKFVVPRIASVLEGFGKELPTITKFILLMADAITYTLYASPFLLLLALVFRKRISKEAIDRFILKLPVVGKVNLYFNLSRFAGVLHMMLGSAAPITEAVKVSTDSLSNAYMQRLLREHLEELGKGRSLTWLLKEAKVFPPLFVNLVETGESSGELEKMLSLSREIYRKEALKAISLWTRMIEPITMLVIGAVVAIIVLSVLLPITEITSSVGKR